MESSDEAYNNGNRNLGATRYNKAMTRKYANNEQAIERRAQSAAKAYNVP